MSFLDNLENNLKALESRDMGGIADNGSREEERTRAKAAAPWAERLKRDPWTAQLMQQMTRAGFQRRTKVNLVWLGTTLRMEARGHKLELRPGAAGVVAVYMRGLEELKREPVDFKEEPQKLVARWMKKKRPGWPPKSWSESPVSFYPCTRRSFPCQNCSRSSRFNTLPVPPLGKGPGTKS
jgi:hypothetical protein